jgi:hypothetical protein
LKASRYELSNLLQEELVAKGLASALLLHVLAPIKVVISFAAQQKILERSNR